MEKMGTAANGPQKLLFNSNIGMTAIKSFAVQRCYDCLFLGGHLRVP